MLSIGDIKIANPVIAAPMAGVSDLPYRRICRNWDAGLAVTEMVTSRPELRDTKMSRLRMSHTDEPGPISVQIVGTDPSLLAEAAIINVDHGADIIDINMGCPSKKVCKQMAGSALMGDERLVAKILTAVVESVKVPVTLKIRTGLDLQRKNAVQIARIAEQSGVQMLTVHGRTRACRFKGPVEYITVADVINAVKIPVIANGDIDSPDVAIDVIQKTGAAGVMVGRAAIGQPWVFREIGVRLGFLQSRAGPSIEEKIDTMVLHLRGMHRFYGLERGVILARKHAGNYMMRLGVPATIRASVNRIADADQQLIALSKAVLQAQSPIHPSLNLAARAA
ncbi:MAG TPA: tRNA dihydrouridine synthase DusB [Gammaproteobacteria bacterium]|jgi:tRNA-dihydrouridine synthase B|nr:tRNA dihydrouridine synthase DusB [Pseudomonadota bacterium]HAY47273.1 tRNA dihydrouridine synthase DusB [Gammaproteobacteria bacterium]